jgi:hypothetical protein
VAGYAGGKGEDASIIRAPAGSYFLRVFSPAPATVRVETPTLPRKE